MCLRTYSSCSIPTVARYSSGDTAHKPTHVREPANMAGVWERLEAAKKAALDAAQAAGNYAVTTGEAVCPAFQH